MELTGEVSANLRLQDKRFELSPSSDYEEFLTLMKDDRRTANLDRDILKVIFDRVSTSLRDC